MLYALRSAATPEVAIRSTVWRHLAGIPQTDQTEIVVRLWCIVYMVYIEIQWENV